jgi:hypothetical protein
MSVIVWLITGIAIWHFAIFVPDRFWGGIVGAFGAAVIGSLAFGSVIHLITGGDIDDTSLVTLLIAAVGAVLGLAAAYVLGERAGEEPI